MCLTLRRCRRAVRSFDESNERKWISSIQLSQEKYVGEAGFLGNLEIFMKKEFEISGADVADAKAIVRLIALADEEAVVAISGKEALSEALVQYEQNFSRTDVYFSYENVLVARKDGGVIACILYFKGVDEDRFANISSSDERMPREADDDEIYIDSLAVDPDHRGEGIAGQLVRSVIMAAQRQGFTKVGLLADASRPRLSKLYRSLGFTERRRIRCRGGEYEKLTYEIPVGGVCTD